MRLAPIPAPLPYGPTHVTSISVTARESGDHWVLDGQKMWIRNAPVGDCGLVYAVTDKSKKHRGIE
ncbi:MAG: acyl-CoA dehydrogenase family protein [Syntrophobacteraceae bacterium]